MDTISPTVKSRDRELKLESIKTQIEGLQKQHHIEILRILKQHSDTTLNENRNGVYINLSYVSDAVVEQVEQYLKYIVDQESSLEQLEERKRHLVEGTPSL